MKHRFDRSCGHRRRCEAARTAWTRLRRRTGSERHAPGSTNCSTPDTSNDPASRRPAHHRSTPAPPTDTLARCVVQHEINTDFLPRRPDPAGCVTAQRIASGLGKREPRNFLRVTLGGEHLWHFARYVPDQRIKLVLPDTYGEYTGFWRVGEASPRRRGERLTDRSERLRNGAAAKSTPCSPLRAAGPPDGHETRCRRWRGPAARSPARKQ